MLIAVLETALPVFAALALGMLCRSKGFLTRDGVDALKNVVINFTLPFVLVNAFATAEYSLTAVLLPLTVYGVCCIALALGFLIIRLCKMKSSLAPFLASGFEAGMLGYALYALLFPHQSTSHLALLDIGQALFVFTLYKILLSGKKDWKLIGKDMLTSPILWAMFVGVLLGATGLYDAMTGWGVSGILDSVTSFLSAPTGMIILLTVGYDLVLTQIPWKKTGALVLMRLAVMAVCFALLVLLNRTVLDGMIFEGAALLLVILPPPYVIPVFANEPAERTQIASALSALTLVTMVLFALCSVFINLS